MYFQPTMEPSDGGDCASLNSPYYVNYCQYSGAAHVLNKVIFHISIITKITFSFKTILGLKLAPSKTFGSGNLQLM